ncbi:MAG: hypothetical protein IT285_08290 [Bdellovibrionales bacterium]|nr:hypothetical protein [Bdellovibrionales bacterium]
MTQRNNLSSDERSFLHDLCAPLGVALIVAERLCEKLKQSRGTDQGELAAAQSLVERIQDAADLMNQRRALLIREESGEESGEADESAA